MRRITSKDLLNMKWVSDPQISPDGKSVLFTVKTVDPKDKARKYRAQIYLARNGKVTPFTSGPKNDTSPRWSPDGSKVAFLSERGEDKTQIFLIPFDGGEARQLTSRKDGVSEPVWSPDGKKITFSAVCENTGDEADIPGGTGDGFGGGEERVCDGERVYVGGACSGDGDFGGERSCSGGEVCGGDGAAGETSPALFDGKSDVRVITNIRYKLNGRGFLPEKKAQILVVDVETGEILQLTSGPYDCREPKWSPDGKHIAFTSARFEDNELTSIRDIYVVSLESASWGSESDVADSGGVSDAPIASDARDTSDAGGVSDAGDASNAKGTSGSVNTANARGASYAGTSDKNGGHLLRKITGTDHSLGSLSWSPDSRTIAFYGHKNEYRGATIAGVCVAAAEGGEIRHLTKETELAVANSAGGDMGGSPITEPTWSEDSKTIYFSALDRGRTHLYSVDAKSKEITQITSGDCVVSGWTKARVDDTFVIHLQSPTLVGDMFALDPSVGCYSGESREGQECTPACSGSSWSAFPEETSPPPFDLKAVNPFTIKRLSKVNEELLSSVTLSEPVEFETPSKDGTLVHGWLMRPIGLKEGEKYPAALEIHGGPHSAYGYAFSHEFQLLAARGYAVVYSNPRGSCGYGQSFLTAIRHDWGGVDYEDVMAAADYAASMPWVDGERMGVLGGSYGGYMTNWAIAHTDRFKAAVSMRSTCNRMSQFGASDAAFTNGEFEFDGDPWDNPKAYLDRSPIMYVRNIKTPVMLIHSEEDLRCPMEQAEEFFTALKKTKKTAVLVRFPNENHELSRSGQPRHRVERLEYILAWFDRYLSPEGGCYEPVITLDPNPPVVLPKSI